MRRLKLREVGLSLTWYHVQIHYQSLFPRSEPPRSEKFLGSKTLGRLFN